MQKIRFAVRRSRCPVYFKRSLLQIDGVDARSLAEIKRRRTCCTLSIYFGVATTQMCRLSSAFENSGTGYKARAKIKRKAYLLYVEHLFLCSNAVDGMHIFKRPCIFRYLPLYYFYAEFQNWIPTVSIIFSQRAKKDAKDT